MAHELFSEPLDDRLEFVREIGRGGMGVVWSGRDLASGKPVAVKVLHRSDEQRVRRFEREALLTASLEQFGVVRTLFTGTARGCPVIVNELVEGARTFDELLPELPLAERVGLLHQVAEAVGAAHARGIVHRDLKPENILIDEEGRARVTDFGLALSGDVDRLTRSGVVMGTPLYMAPEQVFAQRDRIGPPTDVWALGVILYLVLTGRVPFNADSQAELSRRIATASFDLPSQVDPDTPPDLEALCLRALQSRPEERLPDGLAFARELAACSTAPPSKRGKVWLVPLALMILIGVVLAVGTSNGEKPSSEPEAEPVPASVEPPTPQKKTRELRVLPLGRDVYARFEWKRKGPRQTNSFRSHMRLRAEQQGEEWVLQLWFTELYFDATPITYDSTKDSNPAMSVRLGEQVFAARGRARVDPRTGEVLEVTGMLKESNPSNMLDPFLSALARIGNSFSNWGVRCRLGRVLHVLPPTPGQTQWVTQRSIYPTQEFGMRAGLSSRRDGDVITSTSRGTPRIVAPPDYGLPDGLLLTGTRLSRVVTFAPDGLLREVRIEAEFMLGGKPYRIETSARFSLEGP